MNIKGIKPFLENAIKVKNEVKRHFGRHFSDIKGKDVIFCKNNHGKVVNIKWDNKSDELNIRLIVETNDKQKYEIDFDDVYNLDGFDYRNIKLTFNIEKNNGDVYVLRNRHYDGLVDFLDDTNILEEKLNATKDDIKKIHVEHTVFSEDGTKSLNLEEKDYNLSVDELYSNLS